MRKIVISVMVVISMFVTAVKTEVIKSWGENGLKGKVSKISNYGFLMGMKKKEQVATCYKMDFSVYNKNGKIIENGYYINAKIIVKQLGWLYDLSHYGYDDKGRLSIISNFTGIPQTGPVFNKRTLYRYDTANNISGQTNFGSDGSMQDGTLYTYDTNNNITEKATYYKGIKSPEAVRYSYNAKHKIQKETKYKTGGVLLEIFYYVYAADGNLTEKSYTPYKDNEIADTDNRKITRYIYDENGKIYEESECRTDGSLMKKYACSYDAQGNIFEKLEYNDKGALIRKLVSQYDEKGNIRQVSEYDIAGKKETLVSIDIYKYTYFE